MHGTETLDGERAAAPPRDSPTVPLSRVPTLTPPRPAPSEPVTVPLRDLRELRKARDPEDEWVPPPRATPPPGPRRRRGRWGGVVLLVLLLGLVVVTVTHVLAPTTAPTAPPVAAAPAGTPAAPAPAPVPQVDQAALDRSATAAIDRLVTGGSVGHVSVAAVDTVTGRTFGYAPDNLNSTASVVKLDILETLLMQNQAGDRQLSAGTRQLAARMMQQSDNDAATSLWDTVGGAPTIGAYNRRLGMRDTHLVDRWGSTTTPASDQLALLRALDAPSPLDADSRAYARDLMTHVAPEQSWGVSAAADPGTTPAFKNGWMPVSADGGRWVVASVGVVTAGGHPVLLAVMSEHQPGKDAGIRLVESMSRVAAGAVTSRPELVSAG